METMSRRKFNRIMKKREDILTDIEWHDKHIEYYKQHLALSKHERYVTVQKLKDFDSRMNCIVIQEVDGTTTNSW